MFNITVEGASHVEQNKVCQDNSTSYVDENCAIIIVADGHGADECFRSEIGSKFAVEVTKSVLKKVAKAENFKDNINSYKEEIVNKWNEKVLQHFNENPFELGNLNNYKEAYGTTLIAVIQLENLTLGLQIGDGICVVVNENGEYTQPMPIDEKCFLNETTSLCDENPLESFRHFLLTEKSKAIFLGTDGVDDCFNNNEQLYKLYETISYSFNTTEFKKAKKDLKEYLPRLSSKGSKDDISISGIINLDKLV